jgi:hypothetical protein
MASDAATAAPSLVVSIQEVRVPVAALKAQPIEVRHTYYLLGHMFNELICLQKMISFALPKHDDLHRFRRSAEVSQAMLLFRVACSKIYEACDELKREPIRRTLAERVLPALQDGEKRFDAVSGLAKGTPWLAALRNRVGFHYPRLEQWRDEIEPDDTWEDDLIFVGEKTGNTFYDAADNVLQGFVFGLHTAGAPAAAVDQMVTEMIELLRVMNSFLEEALGVLVEVVLLNRSGYTTLAGSINCPAFGAVFTPYWTAIADGAEANSQLDQ